MTSIEGAPEAAQKGHGAPDHGRDRAEDAALIARVADRSIDAMAELYDLYGDPALRAARRVCGDDLAPDVVQDVFLQLWERPAAYDPARGPLQAFLVMRTRGRAIDVLRSGSSRRAREQGDAALRAPTASSQGLGEGVGTDTWDLLRQLPADQRHAIALAYFGGYSYREVAVLLRQPIGTIKGRIRSGLAQLRLLMTNEDL